MSKVLSKNNRSTEKIIQAKLVRGGIKGWVKHPANIMGKPDFYFSKFRLAVFIHGCFWHGCPRCGRFPKSNVVFWFNKIHANQQRDKFVVRQLRRSGFSVMHIWEHEVKTNIGFKRLQKRINPGASRLL